MKSVSMRFFTGPEDSGVSEKSRATHMFDKMKNHIRQQIDQIRSAGLYKEERVLAGPQGAHIRSAGRDVLNMCANNYLGLAAHPEGDQRHRLQFLDILF